MSFLDQDMSGAPPSGNILGDADIDPITGKPRVGPPTAMVKNAFPGVLQVNSGQRPPSGSMLASMMPTIPAQPPPELGAGYASAPASPAQPVEEPGGYASRIGTPENRLPPTPSGRPTTIAGRLPEEGAGYASVGPGVADAPASKVPNAEAINPPEGTPKPLTPGSPAPPLREARTIGPRASDATPTSPAPAMAPPTGAPPPPVSAAPPTMPPPQSAVGNLFGGLGNWIKTHPQTLMAMGAGLAGTQNWGTGLSRAFSGAAQAMPHDIAMYGGAQAADQLMAKMGATPEQRTLAMQNPAFRDQWLKTYALAPYQLNPHSGQPVPGGGKFPGATVGTQATGSVPQQYQGMPEADARAHFFTPAVRDGLEYHSPDGSVLIKQNGKVYDKRSGAEVAR